MKECVENGMMMFYRSYNLRINLGMFFVKEAVKLKYVNIQINVFLLLLKI